MRIPRSVVRAVFVALSAAAVAGCGSGDDDDQDPSTFRLLGNMSAIAGASPSTASAPRPLWRRAANVLIPRAIAQSVCATSTLEVCLETTAADASRVRECAPVDPETCAFEVELALFEGAQLFVRDVPSGEIAPFGGEVDPLANGCRLLLCDVRLDFDRQVASPAAVLNSCAEPDAPFDCGFARSRTPRPGGGAGGGGGPTPGTPTPTLTPLPIQTAPPGPPPPPPGTAVPATPEPTVAEGTPTETPANATPTETPPQATPTETPDLTATPTDTPDAGPTPTETPPPGCVGDGGSCTFDTDCCSGLACQSGVCVVSNPEP